MRYVYLGPEIDISYRELSSIRGETDNADRLRDV